MLAFAASACVISNEYGTFSWFSFLVWTTHFVHISNKFLANVRERCAKTPKMAGLIEFRAFGLLNYSVWCGSHYEREFLCRNCLTSLF